MTPYNVNNTMLIGLVNSFTYAIVHYWYLGLFVIGLYVLDIALHFKKYHGFAKSKYQYKKRGYLMTSTETKFFELLKDAVGNEYNIFPQIHLSAFLDHEVGEQWWEGAFSHVNQKSVDYLVCDKKHLKPLVAIELDDSSHNRKDRISRDRNVEQILEESNMPLVRFSAREELSVEDIKKRVLEKI